jgi:hypothetical protein
MLAMQRQQQQELEMVVRSACHSSSSSGRLVQAVREAPKVQQLAQQLAGRLMVPAEATMMMTPSSLTTAGATPHVLDMQQQTLVLTRRARQQQLQGRKLGSGLCSGPGD